MAGPPSASPLTQWTRSPHTMRCLRPRSAQLKVSLARLHQRAAPVAREHDAACRCCRSFDGPLLPCGNEISRESYLDRPRDDGPVARDRSHHRNRHDRNRQAPHRARRGPGHRGASERRRARRPWTTGTASSTAAPDSAERVLASRIDAAAAERQTLEFLEAWVEPRRSPMCGNSICQDRRFLARYMPTLERFFHYRNLDVSTLKELAQRWAPHIAAGISQERDATSRWTTCANRSASSSTTASTCCGRWVPRAS